MLGQPQEPAKEPEFFNALIASGWARPADTLLKNALLGNNAAPERLMGR
jgi:hypothetical protein